MLPLSEKIDENEGLGRVICDSSKPRNYKKTAFYFDEEEQRYIVNVAKFMDAKNNPTELSVNRTSTLSVEKAHELGLSHKKQFQPLRTYHGFAEVKAGLCFKNNCDIKKDDIGGSLPYHANIIYPYAQKLEGDQAIAAELAYKAELHRYEE